MPVVRTPLATPAGPKGEEMSYDAILAATAIGSVLLALLGFWFENRRSRHFAGVNLVFELDRLFNSQEYCELRKQAASSFAGECHRGEEKALRAIVNFFEGIAYYVDRRLIDRRTVWPIFYSCKSESVLKTEVQRTDSGLGTMSRGLADRWRDRHTHCLEDLPAYPLQR